jgi:eukaryotic-like serine/threonine-protein kinase
MASLSSLLQNGDLVLNRYRVVDSLAVGGHSVVYLGHDERLARPVCIKIFSGVENESGVGRTSYEHFVQEAFALSKLTHPNTLRIFDFGHLADPSSDANDVQGAPMQICEYMNGGTLSQMIRDHGPPPLSQAIGIITSMCAALAEAHSLGITHRDIKPQNILFGNVGNERLAKLADFGIAKWQGEVEAVDAGQRADDTQVVAGRRLAMYSPSWAAPEQLAGTATSPATDIYSLANVAVFLLTGEVIFFDEDMYAGYQKRKNAEALVRAAFQVAAQNPDTAVPTAIADALADALIVALAFEAGMRHPHINDFSKALNAACETPTPPARKARITDRPAPPPIPARTPTGPILRPSAPVLPVNVDAMPRASTPDEFSSRTTQQGYAATPAAAVSMYVPEPVAVPTLVQAVPPIAVALRDDQVLADRRIIFIKNVDGIFDLVGPTQARIRVTLLQATQRYIHIKGMSCFVAPLGGRPSPAIQIDRDSMFALVAGNSKQLSTGALGLATESPERTHWMFAGLGQSFGILKEDCQDAICVDFGPGSATYFVYTQGKVPVPPPKARRSSI